MNKWIFSVSLSLLVTALPIFAAEQTPALEQRHVIIVTSELSFIQYNGHYYLCDTDTPAEMTELAKNCIETRKEVFDYALKATGADVMEVNIEVENNNAAAPVANAFIAPKASKSTVKPSTPLKAQSKN